MAARDESEVTRRRAVRKVEYFEHFEQLKMCFSIVSLPSPLRSSGLCVSASLGVKVDTHLHRETTTQNGIRIRLCRPAMPLVIPKQTI